jgi:hypothetical protein
MQESTMDLSGTPQTDPALLLRFRDRQYAADMLAVAIGKLNLFSWINARGTVSTEAIGEHFQLAARPLDVLLTLCRASGLIHTEASTAEHRLTALGEEHLVDSSPYFLGPYYQPIVDSPIAQGCLQVLRQDRPANWQANEQGSDWHASMMEEAFARDFTALMNCRGLAMGQALAEAVAPLLREASHVLDVGGGSGVYAAALVSRCPHLKATVLEQPPVDRIAAEELKRFDLAERVQVASGNMFDDPWPSDVDCVLLSNVLHDWDLPPIRRLAERTADALPRGGWVIIHEAFLNEDKSGPLPVAEYSVLLANITQGRCYAPGEYGAIFRQAGFEIGPYRDTIADRGFMTARKA